MGRKNSPGLYKRNNIWYIKKTIYGRTIRESTQTCDLAKAEEHLAFRVEQIRKEGLFGERRKRYFHEAFEQYVLYKKRFGKATLKDDLLKVKNLWPHIAHLFLDEIHMDSLAPYIDDMKEKGRKNATINHGLQLVRHILNLAAGEWRDEKGKAWLDISPKIRLLPKNDASKPYPLSWDEQDKLFERLPLHLEKMALFAVNTGCRDQEICCLRWEWEYEVPDFSTTLFVIPAWVVSEKDNSLKGMVKNRQDRVVILNKIAQEVIDSCRGNNSPFVFTFKGRPIKNMLNSGWKKARLDVGLPNVRVHDLKHTFGKRLRTAGVGFEDRQDLLGHKSSRITTHYSAAEIKNLIDAANKACMRSVNHPIVLKKGTAIGGVRPEAPNDQKWIEAGMCISESQIRPTVVFERKVTSF
jgi:integrase